MSHQTFVFLITSLLIVSPEHVSSLKYEGDLCLTTSDHDLPVNGVCRSARDCPQAFSNPYKNPDLCMFTRNDAVICCPKVEASALTLDIHPVGGVQEEARGSRISQLKCTEYEKLTQKISPVAPLVLDPIYFEVSTSNCDRITPLIVNGQKTRHGEFPHMAAIAYKVRLDPDDPYPDPSASSFKFICGGVLISSEYVLTAAHCLNVFGDKPSLVRLGGQKVITSDERNVFREDVPIAEVIAHPEYQRALYYNDIGLLRLSRRVQFNDFVRPACLWHKEEIEPAAETIATGWGVTKFGSKSKSDDLQKVSLSLYSNEECRKLYGRHKRIPRGILQSQLCAGSRTGKQDTCQGDSGGPIQIMQQGNSCIYYVIGITSFGKSCAVSNAPGVYTKVSYYLDWIEEVVWGEQREKEEEENAV